MRYSLSKQLIISSIAGLFVGCMLCFAVIPAASAAENWKPAFDEVCGKVDISQSLSIKEIEALIELADKILPDIQASEDPAKKIYLKRLKNCRSVYVFMVESKKSAGQ